jgi:uncharacterized membrane protein YkvA (DUF1232 family)
MSERREPTPKPTERRELSPDTIDEQVGLFRTLYERTILTWRLLWDPRVGFWPKLIPILGLVYLISPVDLLPMLAVGPLGALDDAGVALLVLNLFVQASPPDVVKEYLRDLRGRAFEPDRGADQDVVDGEAREVEEPPQLR